MLEKRIKHQRIILKQKNSDLIRNQMNSSSNEPEPTTVQEEADEEMVQEAFSTVIAQKKRASCKPFNPTKKRRVQSIKDEENYIRYVAKDHETETG